MSVPRIDHALVMVPPPVLTLLFLLLAFILNLIIPITIPGLWIRWLGVFLVTLALILAFLAVRLFTLAHTSLDPHGSVKVLVQEGPFRFSRNPIYLGFVGILVGLPLALGTIWGLILSPALILALDLLVIHFEEDYLAHKFGEQYVGYRERVNRWL